MSVAQFSLAEAIEKRLKEFITYAASFLAAMMLKRGFDQTLDRYDKNRLWVTWVSAFIIIFFSMAVLVLITWIDTNDVPLELENNHQP